MKMLILSYILYISIIIKQKLKQIDCIINYLLKVQKDKENEFNKTSDNLISMLQKNTEELTQYKQQYTSVFILLYLFIYIYSWI